MTKQDMKEKRFECEICGRTYSTRSNLRKHTRSHTGEKPYACRLCGVRYRQSGGLRNHVASAHGAGQVFTCHYCSKGFPVKERLKLHLRIHTGEKPYSCGECGKCFSRGSLLNQHARTHRRLKPYACSTCSASYSTKSNLVSHMKRHSGERDYECSKCGKAFVRRDGLQKHLSWYHGNYKAFTCAVCNRRYKGHLVQHMRTHAQDKPHECAVCRKRFVQRSQLTVHERTHTGIKPYRCAVCHMAFAHSTALKMHVRRHTGEKPFKCPVCEDRAFSQLPHLKKHMLTIHKTDKPYICSGCGEDFRTKNQLQDHQAGCRNSDTTPEPLEDTPHSTLPLDRIRLLLAVLIQRISSPEKLESLGYGKKLIDYVLADSIQESGREPCKDESLTERERLLNNVRILLDWTVPTRYMQAFKSTNQSLEDMLEAFALS